MTQRLSVFAGSLLVLMLVAGFTGANQQTKKKRPLSDELTVGERVWFLRQEEGYHEQGFAGKVLEVDEDWVKVEDQLWKRRHQWINLQQVSALWKPAPTLRDTIPPETIETVDFLLTLLKKLPIVEGEAVVQSLGKIPAAAPGLIDVLKDTKQSVTARYGAAVAIGKIGRKIEPTLAPEAIKALLKALEYNGELGVEFRAAIILALGELNAGVN